MSARAMELLAIHDVAVLIAEEPDSGAPAARLLAWLITEDFVALEARSARHGLRNTADRDRLHRGCPESVAPQVSDASKREIASCECVQVNPFLVAERGRLGRGREGCANGSCSARARPQASRRSQSPCVWSIAAQGTCRRERLSTAPRCAPVVDQAPSLDLGMARPTIDAPSSMSIDGWKQGLETTRPLRSRPARAIRKNTVADDASACSLENSEGCDACQEERINPIHKTGPTTGEPVP